MHILIQMTNLVITSLTVILQPNHYEQISEHANLILSPPLVTFLQPIPLLYLFIYEPYL